MQKKEEKKTTTTQLILVDVQLFSVNTSEREASLNTKSQPYKQLINTALIVGVSKVILMAYVVNVKTSSILLFQSPIN